MPVNDNDDYLLVFEHYNQESTLFFDKLVHQATWHLIYIALVSQIIFSLKYDWWLIITFTLNFYFAFRNRSSFHILSPTKKNTPHKLHYIEIAKLHRDHDGYAASWKLTPKTWPTDSSVASCNIFKTDLRHRLQVRSTTFVSTISPVLIEGQLARC